MSTKMTIDAISSSAPPAIAPAREMPCAIVVRRSMRSTPLRRGSGQSESLADRLVPLLGALGAAALGPAGQHRAFHQLLVRLGLFGLHRHDRRLGELAHGAGLLAGVAVVGLTGRLLDGRPHLVFVGLELLGQEPLRLWVEPLPGIEVDGHYID